MRVPEEAQADAGKIAPQELEVLQEMPRARHVLLHVAHAAVREQEAVLEHAVRGKRAEVVDGLLRQRAPRALERVQGLVGAALEAEAAGADEVVVAGDAERTALAQHGHAGVGVGVVADEVAHAEELLDAQIVEVAQRRFRRFAVAVDVA